ncbi:DUF1631 family protein [Pseudomarimonas salicorniae]|uniref:DUF1631 domain-containing protein n=1 Tax=Pseudomarimonas salicorniae TaxID=2933270 RepID=A0ABT0GLQ5_9GAMM|nr:DUF1631 family protein [Lysobacter sp. CAU 1642]MCK7595292.1 DUF1631 domain-containing protein [Lysobacter sp. CAU 1642]
MEAPAGNSNVIDMASRGQGPAHPQVFAEVRGISLRKLGGMLAEVLDRSDDALFDFVQRTKSSNEQQDFFDAMRELRRRRGEVEQRYRDFLAESFAALERRRPLKVNLHAAEGADQGLSLVSADDLEEQLAAEQLAALADRRHAEALRQLELRMAQAVGLPLIDPQSLSLGPTTICGAFRAGLQGLELTIKARLVLYKLFERELIDSLGGLVHDCNQRLHQAGILPAVAPARSVPRRDDGIVRETVGDSRDSGSSAYSPQSTRSSSRQLGAGISSGGSEHPPETIDSIFASVRDLCQAVLEAQRMASGAAAGRGQSADAAPSAPRVTLGERHALSALQSLQNNIPESLLRAVDDPHVSLSSLLKQELLKQAERMQLSEPGAGLVEQDEQALFLVGLLFDVLLSQRSYERPVRQQFVRLTVPYARAAMLDQHLFALKTHPARQLLNSLAEACDGNRGESAAERDMLNRVGGVVDKLVADFNEDIAVFSELESDFRDFLDSHRKRVELAEKRAAEAQKGRERLDEARAMAQMELATLMGARSAPPVLEMFLGRYWTHHLAVVFLREGIEAERYRQARQAGEKLWLALLACEAGKDVPPTLRDELTPVLASSGVTGPGAAEVLDAVEWVLLAVRLGRHEAASSHPLPPAMQNLAPLDNSNEEPAPAPSAPGDVAVATAKAEQAEAAEAEGEDVEPPYAEEDVERIKALNLGAWVEFIGENEESIPAKLSWISPISSRLLFVTRRGMRHCAASPQELATLIKQGKLHLRIGDTAFEYAMSQVLGRLREAVPETKQAV